MRTLKNHFTSKTEGGMRVSLKMYYLLWMFLHHLIETGWLTGL